MLNWLKKLRNEPHVSNEMQERWGNYKGEGIWWLCPDCDQPHEVTDSAFFTQVKTACATVSETTREFYSEFQMNEEGGRWDISPDEGIFTKTTTDGRRAHGKYGLVGSWNQQTHSWLWSWEMNEEWMPRKAIEASLELKNMGHQHGWDVTNARHLLLNEHETWHLTNLAAQAAGFPGTYRAKVNDLNHHYFIIDHLEWETVH